MLHDHLLLIISLLFGIAFLTMVSNKLKISYPILLVISGLLISMIPGVPVITLDPDLVFLIFLPPLLYAAAWNTSWKEFWKWRRVIILMNCTNTIICNTYSGTICRFVLCRYR